jgi:hypothetical protein
MGKINKRGKVKEDCSNVSLKCGGKMIKFSVIMDSFRVVQHAL